MKTGKVIRKNIGNSYIPPTIKEAPKVGFGVATIKLNAALDDKARQKFRSAFNNYCYQKQLQLSMLIRGCTIIIERAAHKILWEVLRWLGVEQPQPKASPIAPKNKKQPIVTKDWKPRTFHRPNGGVRFAM